MKRGCLHFVLSVVFIVLIWSTIYHLAGSETTIKYAGIGILVCEINSLIEFFLRKKTIFNVNGRWLIEAGLVLLLYHMNFLPVAVVLTSVIIASPLFGIGMTVYDSIVGISLLLTLAYQMA